MSDNSLEPRPLYRLVGIRHDGSQTVVKGGMTHEEAKLTGEVVEEAGLFASLYVEQESGDDLPTP